MIASEYEKEIRKCSTIEELRDYWGKKAILEDKTKSGEGYWEKGKLLEYVLLRAFELEGVEVTYPYEVIYDGGVLEQIDGVIHCDSIYALIECKDYSETKIDIEPISKLKTRLSRRHGSVIGLFVSMTDFTQPAQTVVQFMAPQIVILWGKKDFEYCLENGLFKKCLLCKYKYALEICDYNLEYHTYNSDIDTIPEAESL